MGHHTKGVSVSDMGIKWVSIQTIKNALKDNPSGTKSVISWCWCLFDTFDNLWYMGNIYAVSIGKHV